MTEIPMLEFTCPFCKGMAAVTLDNEGPDKPYVIHQLPICNQYLMLDVVEYLEAVNKKNASTFN